MYLGMQCQHVQETQLEVYYKVDRLLIGLFTAQQIGKLLDGIQIKHPSLSLSITQVWHDFNLEHFYIDESQDSDGDDDIIVAASNNNSYADFGSVSST